MLAAQRARRITRLQPLESEAWEAEHAGEEQSTEGTDGEYLASGDENSASVDSGRVGEVQRRAGGWDEVNGEAWWLKSRM